MAIAYAVKQANLGNDWELQEYPRSSSLEERFLGKVAQDIRVGKTQIQPSNPLTAELQELQQQLQVLQKMNDPHGVYAILPFNLLIK